MRKFGLIGYPLGHSYSATYFNRKFEAEGLDCRYDLYPVPDKEKIAGFITAHAELIGFNVTIPYKRDIIGHLDSLSEDARAIGAVNVVKRERNSFGATILTGHNTDWQAFATSLQPMLSGEERKALILGTGGASKAVAYALRRLGMECAYVSRNPARAGISQVVGYSDLDADLIRNHLVIVNATPVGMYPDVDEIPPIPYRYLTEKHICYDLIYNPEETGFMRQSAAHGASVRNGLEMLERQAELSWRIWNG